MLQACHWRQWFDAGSHSVTLVLVVFLAVAAPAVALGSVAVGNVFHVASNGTDSNSGTSQQPWRTIQHAADVMGPGDSVLVHGGTYNETVTLTLSGALGNPISFRAYPGETVVLDGDPTTYAGFTTDSHEDVSDIIIDGFTIRNYPHFGIVAWSTNDRLTLTNLVISGNGGTGIRLSNSDGTRIQNVRLENNVGGFDCTPILPGAETDPGCTNLYIADVEAINNGAGNDTAVDAFSVEKGSDIVVERALAAGGPGDGFDFKSDRTTLSRVVAHDARNNIKLWGTNSILVNALAYNATADANLVLAGGGSYTIVNVTIANMMGYAYLAVFGDGGLPTPVRLHNAIFFNDNPVMGGTLVWFGEGVTLTSDNNLYFNSYRTDAVVCASFPPYEYECFSDADIKRQTAHPWIEANSRYADPQFAKSTGGDFSLRAGSAAIDAGTSDDAPAVDLSGQVRPQGASVDIGAYEYSGTGTPPRTATSTTTRSPVPTPTRTATGTATRTPTRTARPTVTPTPTWTRRPTFTVTRTPTRTAMRTATRTVTPSWTPRPSATRTATVRRTPTRSPTATRTALRSLTPTRTPAWPWWGWKPTHAITLVPTRTPTRTATRTPTPTRTATRTLTCTPTSVMAGVTPTPAPGTTPPIVPVIDAAVKANLRAVFLRGQAAGNRPGVFAKIGDSISESASFLQDVGCAQENVGAHSELTAIIDFFRNTTFPSSYTSAWCGIANSFTRDSVSAVAGWAAADSLQPVNVTGCPAPYNTALRCELHLLRPSMALIMYGTNDLERYNDLAVYQSNLTAIVAQSLDAGVIAILSTIPPRLDDPTLGARVAAHNQVVIEVAQAQQVPLLNYWLAMTGPQMVNQGVSQDGVHPNLFGGCAPDCLSADFTDAGLRYGYNQRNFTAIETFGKIKAIVVDNGPADGGAGPSFTPTKTMTPAGAPTPTAASGGPSLAGCSVFPADSAWNRDISSDPVDANSVNYIASINLGADTDIIGEAHLHADFGSPPEYGIPFAVAPGTQPKVPITFTEYGSESDPGPYPIPPTAPIEVGSDHHVLVLDAGTCVLYELYHAVKDAGGPGWFAGSGAVFDLHSNTLRPDGWTSCDQAGLPILPGLVRYEEVAAGEIKHALRFTVWRPQQAWVHPATHYGTSSNPNDPPMGMRVRLKASYDISSYTGQARVVLQALKQYGLFVADTGTSWYITGAPDPRWDDTDLDQLKRVPGRAFEVIQLGTILRP